MCVKVWVWVWVCSYVVTCMCVHVCAYLCLCGYVYVSIYIYVCVCICVFAHICILCHTCVEMDLCIRVCMFVCLCSFQNWYSDGVTQGSAPPLSFHESCKPIDEYPTALSGPCCCKDKAGALVSNGTTRWHHHATAPLGPFVLRLDPPVCEFTMLSPVLLIGANRW